MKMCHTPDKYLDEDIFITLSRSKTIFVSKLLFQLLLFASEVQFYEGAGEQTAHSIQCILIYEAPV